MEVLLASATAARLRQLERLAARLGDALTPDDVARSTLRSALEMADAVRAGVAINSGAGRELNFVSSDDDAVSAVGVRWCQIDGLADVPLAEAVRTGKPVFVPSLHDLGRSYPHILERQRSLGTRSMAALPLVNAEQHLGAVLLSFGCDHEFDTDEQAFLAAFAAQVTQALRRATAYQAEQTTSERLQRSLLPQSLPELEGLALGAHYEPGGAGVDVGGDWYDVLEVPDGSVVVALGDVMGKGVSAAIVMGQVRAAMRAYALLDPAPCLMMQRLDHLVASLAIPEQIVTFAYGLIDPQRTGMTLAVAGHPPPLVVPPQGPPSVVDATTGPPLGLEAGPWRETHIDLSGRVTVLFYSDGLVETRSLSFADGVAAVSAHIAAMHQRRRNPREMCARLAELMSPDDGRDDVTMFAVTSTAGRAPLTATKQLPADTSATPRARRFLAHQLHVWRADDDVVETAQLCVSELVTNAVIHSGTPPKLTIRLDDEHLLVLVQDHGGHGAARRADNREPLEISGRGLALVDALSTAWGADHNADGTTVWFELEVPGS